ncbi:MAG: MATE family efflux transporter [bacterium]|nr:MATE family efflux transporter [bacterium]
MFFKKSRQLDMTQGSIMKLVILFALPICLGNVLQQLYSTVDTLIIGNFCSSISLAAVGTSSQPVEMLLCIFLGLGTGISILVAQYTGKSDTQSLREVTATAISFLYLCAIPLSILGLFIGPLVLRIMQVPDDTWELAVSYIRIIFLGTLGNMGYNMNAGILRGLGDSQSSLLFLLISCILNIVLDLLFVAGFGMDVSGAALATIIAMFVSWLCSIAYIKKKYPELQFSLLPRHLNKHMLFAIIEIGLPLGLNNSIYSIGHIFLQSLINLQGSIFMAACSVGSKVTGIANVSIASFSAAATTFAGQNLGAKNYKRLYKGGRQIPLFSALITLCGGVLVLFFSQPILHFFTSDPEVLQLAVLYLFLTLPGFWAYAVLNSIISFANGMGEVRFPTFVNILMLWAVRIPAAHLIAHFIGGEYLMAALPISFVFGMLAMMTFFWSHKWQEIKSFAKH